MFRVLEPYSQYKTRPGEVTLAVKTGRHGTLKAQIEIGAEILRHLKWVPGDHYIDVFIGTGADAGFVRFQRGTSYKIREMRNKRTGMVVLPATAVGLEKKQPRIHCGHDIDGMKRQLYLVVTKINK